MAGAFQSNAFQNNAFQVDVTFVLTDETKFRIYKVINIGIVADARGRKILAQPRKVRHVKPENIIVRVIRLIFNIRK